MEDSSVIFNLNEIMRLERDRVAAEEAAARAAEANAIAEREARARSEQERAVRERSAAEIAAAELAQRAHEVERQREAARSETLMRIQAETEAERRLAERRIELAHAERLHEIARAERRKRTSWLVAGALVAVAIGGGASYALVLEPALRSARAQSAALDRLTAEAEAETVALARQVEELKRSMRDAVTPQPVVLTSAQPRPPEAREHEPVKRQRERSRARTAKPAKRAPAEAAETDGLGALDGQSDDPLFGLGVDSSPTRKRR